VRWLRVQIPTGPFLIMFFVSRLLQLRLSLELSVQNKTKNKKNKGIHGFDISKKKGNSVLAMQALQQLGQYMIASIARFVNCNKLTYILDLPRITI